MDAFGLDATIVDRAVYDRAVRHFHEARVVLPTFAELSGASAVPPWILTALPGIDPDAPHALNLFRIHWYNDRTRRHRVPVPEHVVLPEALSGVPAPIAVVFGDRFPLIRAHKVLAAYGCLAPRIVTGRFDPTSQRAVWPSTGNYCRGGVAISKIMGCRGVAVLPEGMSAERFAWLERWVADPCDILKTPGSESNVKEIYDACDALARDPANVVFNQFAEFGNYLAHYACTGRALERLVDTLRASHPALEVRAFVTATGSAGTLAAGDYLKARYGSTNIVLEPLECPTLLYNGFGEHTIQGIGDKHVPLIHNVMGTDAVAAVSDRATDALALLFNSDVGREYLRTRRRVPPDVVDALASLGLSSICNVLGAIKTARLFDLGPDDLVVTVATDGAALYASEWPRIAQRRFGGRFDATSAAEVFGQYILGAATDHCVELTRRDRERIFNLGYYTWVEQRGVPLDQFLARRDPGFWTGLLRYLDVWDDLIREFNARVGLAA